MFLSSWLVREVQIWNEPSDKKREPSSPWIRKCPVTMETTSGENWYLFCGDMVEIFKGKDAGKQNNVISSSPALKLSGPGGVEHTLP
jgi:hypothetical protein